MPTRAKRHACALTASRHVVWASSMARDTLAARDLRAARTACRRRSRGGAQGDGGRCLRSLQASPPKVATLRAAGRRDGPRRVDVSARPRNRSRERTPRQSRHPEVAPDVSVPRQRGIATSLQTRLASMTEAAKHHRSVSLEEPGARVKHEAPGHPSRDVFGQAGRLEDGRLRLHRLKDGETSLGPS